MNIIKKIFISVYGCDRRKLDAKRLGDYFSKNDYILVNDPKESDYIIFVACGFSKEVQQQNFEFIKKFQRYDSELIVFGCLPAIRPKQLSTIFNGRTIVTKDLSQNPEKIDQLFAKNKIKFKDIPDTNVHGQNFFSHAFEPINSTDDKNPLENIRRVVMSSYLSFIENFSIIPSMTTLINIFPKMRDYIIKNFVGDESFISKYISEDKIYHLRITWGCTGNCSYCGIKKAVGPIKSKPLDVCINEFKKGLELGYKDFLIDSDDSGPYGLEKGHTFPELLESITEIEGDYQIIISGLNPAWAVKYVDELESILKSGKIKEIIFTLQSGSSRILKLMNRYSHVEKIKDSYRRFKKACPDLKLILQLIVGFPTENEEDFKESLAFIKEFKCSTVTIFGFSCIEGTLAGNIEPKVPQEIIDKRIAYTKKLLKKEGYKSIFMHGLTFYKK